MQMFYFNVLTHFGLRGSVGPGLRGVHCVTLCRMKMNAYTFQLFLNIPIDHFRMIKYKGKEPLIVGLKCPTMEALINLILIFLF